MIIEVIIRVFIFAANTLAGLMPVIGLTVPAEFIGALSMVVATVHYFLPISFMLSIFMISMAIRMSWALWRILLRAKSFVPMWGN